MYTTIQLTTEQFIETLIVPDWKTLGECCDAYLRHSMPADLFAYTVLAVDTDGARRRLALDQLVGELALAPTAHLFISRETVDPPPPPIQASSGHISTVTTLRCRVQVTPKQCILVAHEGLEINRTLIRNAHPLWQRWLWKLRSSIGIPSPLDAIAEQRHCVIVIDPHQGQWVLRALEALVIEGRFCAAGSTLLLPAATTSVRLGTNGPTITIQMEMP